MPEAHTMRICLNVFERHNDALSAVLNTTEIGKSEFVRRCLDYCLTEHHFNVIVPTCSGQMGGLLR